LTALLPKNYQNHSMFVEVTASQTSVVF